VCIHQHSRAEPSTTTPPPTTRPKPRLHTNVRRVGRTHSPHHRNKPSWKKAIGKRQALLARKHASSPVSDDGAATNSSTTVQCARATTVRRTTAQCARATTVHRKTGRTPRCHDSGKKEHKACLSTQARCALRTIGALYRGVSAARGKRKRGALPQHLWRIHNTQHACADPDDDRASLGLLQTGLPTARFITTQLRCVLWAVIRRGQAGRPVVHASVHKGSGGIAGT
jgi:hypothetical protein